MANEFNHIKEIYELIDTGLKIGLGALISGITTYFITKQSHKHEIKKEKFNQKTKILNDSIEIVEEYLISCHRLVDFWYGCSNKELLKNLNEKHSDELLSLDKNYINNEHKLIKALAYFNILGLENVKTKIVSYDRKMVNKRNEILTVNKQFPIRKDIKTFMNNLDEIKKSYYKELNIYFESL